MEKASELSLLALELKKCGEAMINISDELTDMLSGADEEKQPAKKAAPKKKVAEEPKAEVSEERTLTLEAVRAVCADKSRKGFTAEVKAILTKYGADKLSEVDPAEYKELLAEVEVLGNAG